MKLAVGLVLSLGAIACARPLEPSSAEASFTYVIAPPPAGSWELSVEASFDGLPPGPARLGAPGSQAMHDVALVRGAGATPLASTAGTFVVPACGAHCTVRYIVDLDGLAARCRRMDCERRLEGAVVGTAASWLLRPEGPGDAVIHLRTRSTDGGAPSRFVTGLRRDPADPGRGYVFRARELGESSYTAFGEFRRTTLEVAGAHLDIALLGAPLAMGDAAAVAWVGGAAARVATLFGRFPVDATVFVVPVHRARSVVFGRVMSLTGASIAILFGDDATADDAHADWIVVHELFHLACPSFSGEGRWLEEGLATYYEPILRERGGWISETQLWAHFAREMPRGLRAAEDPPGLEDRDDIDATYWGGALFALVADVRIRASKQERSLDDVLRAALMREGDATHVARVVDFLRIGDEATAAHDLTSVYESWAVRGENPDLAALWANLGIVAAPGDAGGARVGESGVTLRDDAPLAWVRKAIAAGTSH